MIRAWSTPIPAMYRFLDRGVLNSGSDESFRVALCDLAEAGWALYADLVPQNARPRFETLLAGDPEIVHAGQLSLDGVVPWNLLYMRPFDAALVDEPAACSAPIENKPCGTHPDCPLHATNAHQGLTEETTACPRYFLGFRQMIEVPPQQVAGMNGGADGSNRSMKSALPCGAKVRTLVGYNKDLKLATKHENDLRAGVEKADFSPLPLKVRNELLQELGAADPVVVYIYCHAMESVQLQRQKLGPHLVIEDVPTARGRITPANIAAIKLPKTPLVFLNGCHTVGFTPFGPAEFIRRFADCGASAVIGTEATVWEGLAVEMAEAFLRRFIDAGKTAGEALLEARLALLEKKNPLGLAYTLYGPADLKLTP